MCSIVGFLGLGGTQANSDVEVHMNRTLRLMGRRGPDQVAVVRVSPHRMLGGNRLIVRGNQDASAMPFSDGSTTAFYKWRNLNSHIWTDSPCDGSAILPAHTEHCIRFASKFDGEFAIRSMGRLFRSYPAGKGCIRSETAFLCDRQPRLIWSP